MMDINVIVMIVNSNYSLINAFDKLVIKLFGQTKLKQNELITNKQHDTYGCNIIGSQKAILKNVQKARKKKSQVIEAKVDSTQRFFAVVDHWKDNNIGVKYEYKRRTVVDLTTNQTSLILLQSAGWINNKDKFDHFVNILVKDQKLKTEIPCMPELFICLNFPEQVLFLEEFLHGFLNQDYPPDKIHLQVSFSNEKQRNKIHHKFTKMDFG